MTETWREHEARILDQLEERYGAQGYVVHRETDLEGSKLHADMVIERGDETVMIEVKHRARERDSSDPRLEDLAEYAAERDWRFTIVLVGDLDHWEEVEIPRRDEVLRLLDDARELDSSSWIAPIAATAAFEAAARFALTRAAHAPMPRPSPRAYVQALASMGMIAPEEEDVLRKLVEKRNAAAHGFSVRPLPDDVVPKALEIARALLQPEPAAA